MTLIALGAIAAPVASVALATPPTPADAVKSELLARGAAGTFRIHDKSMDLKLSAKRATDVAVVRATLVAGGSTGWHGHAGPSIVIVKTGELTMREPHHGHHSHRPRCDVTTFKAGSAFVHPEHEHEFVNDTAGVVEFHLVYFVPAGASPAPIDVTPAPKACT